ncbi:unnamed protein product, partial [Meganyctiphanes norvegica]
ISCSTTNASSHQIINTVTVKLKVNLPPVNVSLDPVKTTYIAGEDVSFGCHVTGSSPEPVVQWWLAGRQLSIRATMNQISRNVSESRVQLTPAPGDHGQQLVCKAFSPA